MAQVLHLTGPVLVGPDDVRASGLGASAGRITYARSPPVTTTSRPCPAGCCPAWSTRTATSASTRHGAVDDATAEAQALADRDAGALLLRDAGSPADTRWVQDRDDLPRLVRAGRHIARTRRYIRNFAWEVEPEQLVDQVRLEARAGDGWVKLVGDWIDRDTGDLSPVLAGRRARRGGRGRPRGGRPGDGALLRGAVAARPRRRRHRLRRARLRPRGPTRSRPSRRRASPSCRPSSTSTPSPQIAEPAREKFPDYHRHMLDLHARRYATIAAAREAGIPVYVGTDAGGSLPHGLVATEVAHLAHAGFTTDRGARGGVLGRAARGSAGPASRRARRPTSSSTPRTRARTSRSSPRRRPSSSAAASSPDPSVTPAGPSHIARHKSCVI